MAEDPHHNPSTIRPSGSTRPHTTTTQKGGSGWKWAAGAGVAALVVGLGWAAMNNDGARTDTAEIAYNEQVEGADRYAGPLPSERSEPLVDTAASDEAPAATPARSSSERRSSASRTQTARASQPVVMEQTVGVSEDGSVQMASVDQDEVVVEGRRVVRPNWTRTPSAYRLSTAYPDRALERGREGEARVSCVVLETGRLDCAPVSEYPANNGFGRAAVRVAEYFRHDAVRVDGAPAAGTPVNLRVVFQIDDSPRRG